MTKSMNVSGFFKRQGNWVGFFVLVLFVTVLTKWGHVVFESLPEGDFLSDRNLTNLLRQTSINGVLAAGMTLIILTSGIDLSIGSLVALSGVVIGISQVNWGWASHGTAGALQSVLLGLAVGLCGGVITGSLVAFLRIPPFVITLGMMVIARGVALIVSDGAGISPMSDEFKSIADTYLSSGWVVLWVIAGIGLVFWGNRRQVVDAVLPSITFAFFGWAFMSYKGLPILAVFLFGVLGLCSFLLSNTTLGRSIYAVGSNEQAAHWAGVSVTRVKWFVYSAMGMLSGLAASLLTARLNGAVPTAGELFELDAIAAVVIGGTSLKGGYGTVIGSLAGALTIATLNNGMDLLGVPSFYQNVFKGLIIIVAVALDRGQRRNV